MSKLILITALMWGMSSYAETQVREDAEVMSDISDESSSATGATEGESVEPLVAEPTQTSRTEAKEEEEMKTERKNFFAEPLLFIGQNEGDVKATGSNVGDDTADIREAGLGLRLGGYLGERFFLAADGRYGRSSFSDSFYKDVDSNHMNYGVVAGVQTPWAGIRVWGTSVLGGELNPDEGDDNLDLKFTDARGYRVGAGLNIAAVSLNLEYQNIEYGDTDIESAGIGNVRAVDASEEGVALVLGFPIGF